MTSCAGWMREAAGRTGAAGMRYARAMTAALAPLSFAPSLAMLEALARLVESDPKALAAGRTVG